MKPRNELSREGLINLLVAQGFSILPLMVELPWWILGFWFCAVLWRIQIFRGVIGFPGRFTKYCIAGLGVVGLFVSIPRFFSVEGLVAFLLVSFCLKLLESHRKQDAVLIVNVGFMSLASYFLFSKSLGAALYVVFASIILLNAWISFYRERTPSWTASLKRCGRARDQSGAATNDAG
jgi:hypothetical protein